ncbi:MAG: trypsin-like peptidase domain-containing protein [Pseudomonadota bacterium]
MDMIKSRISITTIRLHMSFNDTELATGTGFFYEAGGKPFLITNRHNLTGRDNNTGKMLDDKTGGLPNRLSFSVPKYVTKCGIVEFSGTERVAFDLGWELKSPPWLEHPKLGKLADVIALDLGKIWPNAPLPVAYVNKLPHNHPLSVLPASTVSVVGYPFGTSVNQHYPVWVTGAVASEPNMDVEGKPAMYIDCRTNKGASGSPVFMILNGGTAPMDSEASGNDVVMRGRLGNAHSASFYVPVHRFLGVYSGRLNKNSDIGFLWRESAVEDVCALGTKAESLE